MSFLGKMFSSLRLKTNIEHLGNGTNIKNVNCNSTSVYQALSASQLSPKIPGMFNRNKARFPEQQGKKKEY